MTMYTASEASILHDLLEREIEEQSATLDRLNGHVESAAKDLRELTARRDHIAARLSVLRGLVSSTTSVEAA